MTMSQELYLALLSMDSYNRGGTAGGAGLVITGTSLGMAQVG